MSSTDGRGLSQGIEEFGCGRDRAAAGAARANVGGGPAAAYAHVLREGGEAFEGALPASALSVGLKRPTVFGR